MFPLVAELVILLPLGDCTLVPAMKNTLKCMFMVLNILLESKIIYFS